MYFIQHIIFSEMDEYNDNERIGKFKNKKLYNNEWRK